MYKRWRKKWNRELGYTDWKKIINFTGYKSTVDLVDPYHTSKGCSRCGCVNKDLKGENIEYLYFVFPASAIFSLTLSFINSTNSSATAFTFSLIFSPLDKHPETSALLLSLQRLLTLLLSSPLLYALHNLYETCNLRAHAWKVETLFS